MALRYGQRAVTVIVSGADHGRLSQLAFTQDQTVSEYLRTAVNEYLTVRGHAPLDPIKRQGRPKRTACEPST